MFPLYKPSETHSKLQKLMSRSKTKIRSKRQKPITTLIFVFDSMDLHMVTIFANGEREIGELIAKFMKRVGKEGVITIVLKPTIDKLKDPMAGIMDMMKSTILVSIEMAQFSHVSNYVSKA